jgi:hypothetical protein
MVRDSTYGHIERWRGEQGKLANYATNGLGRAAQHQRDEHMCSESTKQLFLGPLKHFCSTSEYLEPGGRTGTTDEASAEASRGTIGDDEQNLQQGERNKLSKHGDQKGSTEADQREERYMEDYEDSRAMTHPTRESKRFGGQEFQDRRK